MSDQITPVTPEIPATIEPVKVAPDPASILPTTALPTPAPKPTMLAKPVAGVDPTKKQSIVQITAAPFIITPLKSDRKYFKVIIYGGYGTGKTTLMGSCVDIPEMRDVIMVNAESGTMSIEDAEQIHNRHLIDSVRCADFKTVALVQEFLKAHCIARDAKDIKTLRILQHRTFGHPLSTIDDEALEDEWESIEKEDILKTDFTREIRNDDGSGNVTYEKLITARLRLFKTAIIDSLSEIDTFSMYQLLGIKTDMKLDAEMEIAEWGEFRKNNQMMQLLVRAYRDLPMNVLIVCGAKYIQDQHKAFNWTPTLTGQLANQVQGFVDVVGYLTNSKPKEGSLDIPRRLFIQPVDKFAAKSRMASFKDSYIDDPNFADLMNAYRGVSKGPLIKPVAKKVATPPNPNLKK